MPGTVATALSVNPAQATSASGSMSPEHALAANPPVAGVQAGSNERLARFDPAGDAFAEPPARAERDQRNLRRIPVAVLQRQLHRSQVLSIHRMSAGSFRLDLGKRARPFPFLSERITP
jgi:hypothetical protein